MRIVPNGLVADRAGGVVDEDAQSCSILGPVSMLIEDMEPSNSIKVLAFGRASIAASRTNFGTKSTHVAVLIMFRFLALTGLIVVILSLAVLGQQAAPPPTPSFLSGVYLIYYRTPMHVKASKAEVFDEAIAAVSDYLTTKKVAIIADPERGVIRTQDTMSPQNMANLARDATADSVLLVSVDRPIASWIKLTVGAYDLSGNKLWEESASYGGGMNGKAAISKTMEKLQPKLDAHLAKPGLPVKG